MYVGISSGVLMQPARWGTNGSSKRRWHTVCHKSIYRHNPVVLNKLLSSEPSDMTDDVRNALMFAAPAQHSRGEVNSFCSRRFSIWPHTPNTTDRQYRIADVINASIRCLIVLRGKPCFALFKASSIPVHF